jgi:hypothetical protein
VEGAKARDLQTVYQLQLEREVAARREYELGIQARVRKELRLDVADMIDLRAELATLRKNLDRVLAEGLGMDRPTLHADSMRVTELTAVDPRNGGLQNGLLYPAGAHSSYGPPPPMFVGVASPPPAFAGPYDAPVTAETSSLSRTAHARDCGLVGPHPELDATQEWQAGELGTWSDADSQPTPADDWETEPQHGWSEPDWSESEPDWSAAEPEHPVPGRPARECPVLDRSVSDPPTAQSGTERSAMADGSGPDGSSHSRGLSVAQILANLRSEAARIPAAHPHRRHQP